LFLLRHCTAGRNSPIEQKRHAAGMAASVREVRMGEGGLAMIPGGNPGVRPVAAHRFSDAGAQLSRKIRPVARRVLNPGWKHAIDNSLVGLSWSGISKPL
jgi:hypothetical protein